MPDKIEARGITARCFCINGTKIFTGKCSLVSEDKAQYSFMINSLLLYGTIRHRPKKEHMTFNKRQVVNLNKRSCQERLLKRNLIYEV